MSKLHRAPEAYIWVPSLLLEMPPAAATAVESLQSCPTLCDPRDGSAPGSPAPGILQARTLEWVAIAFSNACTHAHSLQSCLSLCHPIVSSPPGSSVHGILQAGLLEWVAISFSRYAPNPAAQASHLASSCSSQTSPASPPGAGFTVLPACKIISTASHLGEGPLHSLGTTSLSPTLPPACSFHP